MTGIKRGLIMGLLLFVAALLLGGSMGCGKINIPPFPIPTPTPTPYPTPTPDPPPPPPPPPNRPPSVTCRAESVLLKPGEKTKVLAIASDPEGEELTYVWTTNIGSVGISAAKSGPEMLYDSTGVVGPAEAMVVVTAADPHQAQASASCAIGIEKAEEPPPPPPPPVPSDCSLFKPDSTGFGLISCTQGGKVLCTSGACNKPPFTTGKPGQHVLHLPAGAVCAGDSTPRYNGVLPCFKTCECVEAGDDPPCNEWPNLCDGGKVERCEYPHPPAYGSACGATTVWSTTGSVQVIPDGGGYGAKIKFSGGSGKISACRKPAPGEKLDSSLCTVKEYK